MKEERWMCRGHAGPGTHLPGPAVCRRRATTLIPPDWPRMAAADPSHLPPATVAGAPAQAMTNPTGPAQASSMPQSTFVPASAPQPGLVAVRVGEDGKPAEAA